MLHCVQKINPNFVFLLFGIELALGFFSVMTIILLHVRIYSMGTVRAMWVTNFQCFAMDSFSDSESLVLFYWKQQFPVAGN